MNKDRSLKREWVVKARLVLEGAWMVVDAATESEAKAIAEKDWDYETQSAELVDVEVTSVEPNE